nr:hypothetical protein [Pseudomonas sp. UBA6718]
MARVVLTPALRGEYAHLFDSCRIRPERGEDVESLVKQLLNNQPRYEKVAEALGIPWSFIAVIHNMESSQSFHKHLHNGDPLTARTVQQPLGRPKNGSPPFTWEQSAADALQPKRLGADTDWSLGGPCISWSATTASAIACTTRMCCRPTCGAFPTITAAANMWPTVPGPTARSPSSAGPPCCCGAWLSVA